MKEYIKKFESATSADNYSIVDIPFTTSIAPSSDYPSINYIQNLVCNQTGKKLVNNDGIVSIYSNEPVIPNDEIWYTSSDGNIVTPYQASSLPEIDTNTYGDGKGVIKFKTDVTNIGYDAFYYCTSLASIEIPNSVTSIGNESFYYCTSLTSVTIPNSVTSIGEYAFSGCTELTSITIPNSVTSIGNESFYECIGLTSIEIPNSVTSIGNNAFNNCINLTSITIGNNVTSIGWGAFRDCINLTSITIGNNVTSIGWGAFFMGDDFVGEPSYPGSLQTIIVVGGQTYNYNGEEQFTITLANGTNVTLNMWMKVEDEPEEPAEVQVTIEHEDETSETVTLSDSETYADQGYSGYYSQDNYDSSMGETAETYLVNDDYPYDGQIIYDYCDDDAPDDTEEDPVTVTIEHQDGTSETVTLDAGLTYDEQGYDGYYSQNTYDSNVETPEVYLVDNDYPADGATIYDYCSDDADPEPEDPDAWDGESNINSSDYIVNKGIITVGTPVVVSVNEEVAEYDFTPLETGSYTVYSNGGDTFGAIYQGNTQIASNDDGSEDTNFSMNCNLEAGVTYSIRATMLSEPSGTFTVHVDFDNPDNT